jgi:hypothetical protein
VLFPNANGRVKCSFEKELACFGTELADQPKRYKKRWSGYHIPIWYMRLFLPNNGGYHTVSTCMKNEFEASKQALTKFEEFQVRA